MKKVLDRIFIDGLSGMAQGLFATLIIGTIIQQIGTFAGGDIGELIYLVGKVAAGLTGDNTVTPYKVAQFSAGNGYYAGDSGTSWSLMTEGAQQFGIYGEEMGLSEDDVFSALENGHPIICSMRPGDFTTTGHFIVLTGVEDGKIRVNDPNSRVRSGKLWDYSRLEYQINNLWAYTVL